MDKHTIIGLILLFGVLLGFSFYTSHRTKQVNEQMAKELTETSTAIQKDIDTVQLSESTIAQVDSAASKATTQETVFSDNGVFGCTDSSKKVDYIVNTNVAQYQISRIGGYVKRVELTQIYRYTPKDQPKEHLVLFDGDATSMGFDFKLQDYTELNTRNLFFKSSQDTLNVFDGESKSLSVRLYPKKRDSLGTIGVDTNAYIEYLYTFRPNDYQFDFTVHFVNLSAYINPNKREFLWNWQAAVTNVEKNYNYERDATTLYYMDNLSEVSNLNERASDSEDFSTQLKWVSFKQQFFTSIILAKENSFTKGHLEVNVPEERQGLLLKNMCADLGFDVASIDSGAFNMELYFGPNQYKLLEPYGLNLEKQVPLGWGFFLLHWINRAAVIPIFNWLEAYGLSYGLIILILTIIIKVVLLPIAYKTYMSSAKMRVLKPELEELNARFPKQEDAMKKQQATMTLYKRAGVSPASGCLPMLLQMPILIAMFRFFPSAYELRQQPFLWAEDLSTYDSILDLSFNIPFYGDHVSLFTLLMTIATLVYTWLNNKMMNPAGGNDQMKMMKVMMYMMPILFLGMFNSFSAALTYYYLLVNLITFLQMWIFRMLVNEENLRKKLLQNMNKPVKKSKWQMRMEEMMKQQQALKNKK